MMKGFFQKVKAGAQTLFASMKKFIKMHSTAPKDKLSSSTKETDGEHRITKGFFKNMKVKKRLITAFLWLAVVSTILAGVGIYSMQESAQTELGMQMRFESMPALLEVRQNALLVLSLSEEAVLNVKDTTSMSSIATAAKARAKDYEEAHKKLMTTVMTPEWRTKLETAEADFKNVGEAELQEALKWAKEGYSDNANTYLRRASSTINDRVLNTYSNYLTARVKTAEKEYQDDVARNRMLLILLIILSTGGVVFSIVVGIRVSNEMNAALKKIMNCTVGLADGNLSIRTEYQSRNEFGVVASSLNQSCDRLQDIVTEVSSVLRGIAAGRCDYEAIRDYNGDFKPISEAVNTILDNLNKSMQAIRISAEQVDSGSQQVADGAQELAQGSTEQASSVEELSASITDISTKINETFTGITEIAKTISSTAAAAETGDQQMKQLLDAMDSISSSSMEITKIIKVIDSIAFQTNILALNASVEAARAGEAGKGFAVVAEEIRNLAGKSADAAKQTAKLIGNSSERVEEGLSLASKTAGTFSKIVQEGLSINTTIQNIKDASSAQSTSISQVTQGIDQVSAVVQTNSATAEESAAASEELSAQANRLKDEIGWLHLREY